MLHVAGASLVLCASILLRQSLLRRARLRRRTLRALSESFDALALAVRATLAPLPALLRDLSCMEEAAAFFRAVCGGLADGKPLDVCWREAALTLPLSERERELTAALGSALGGEEESVCAALLRTARELSEAERVLGARAREEMRVTTALCLGGGTLLSILLL